MQHALDNLAAVCPELDVAAVIGPDGEILAFTDDEEKVATVGPVITTLSAIAGRATQELGRGGLDTTILEGSLGRVVARDVGMGNMLVAVATPDARLGLLLDDVRACADQMAREVAHA